MCHNDIIIASSVASGATCTSPLAAADLGGLTLTAGIYCYGTLSITTFKTLTLDAQNNPNALWIFQATTTLITGLRSAIILKNGAQIVNVIWAIGSSATIGVNSIFVGNILAQAAIVLSARSLIQGRALALTAVTVDSGSWLDRGYTFVSGAIDILSCAQFVAFGGAKIAFQAKITAIVRGSIGTAPGTSITGTYNLITGTAYLNTGPALTCKSDLARAYNDASVATCEFNLAAAALDGLTLYPGVYCSVPGTFSMAASGLLILDAQNNSNSQWVFQSATTVITGAGSSIRLINGGKPNNIYWAVGTSATTGSDSKFIGNILALTSITLGYQTILSGRAFALNTVTFAGNITVNQPPIDPTSQPSSAPSTQPSR